MAVPSRVAATWRPGWVWCPVRQPRLLGISQRGNRYLRKNLIHGASSVLPYLVQRETPLGRWVMGLLARAHENTVVVALANKLARIAWAVWSMVVALMPHTYRRKRNRRSGDHRHPTVEMSTGG